MLPGNFTCNYLKLPFFDSSPTYFTSPSCSYHISFIDAWKFPPRNQQIFAFKLLHLEAGNTINP